MKLRLARQEQSPKCSESTRSPRLHGRSSRVRISASPLPAGRAAPISQKNGGYLNMKQKKLAIPGIGSGDQAAAKLEMYDHLKHAPSDNELILGNLPLYLRSVMLAKILYVNE